MAKISVVIPVYNGAKTIESCLESIFHQTFDSLQIIVVNDGSTDQTAKILDKYKNRITLINQPNKGATTARNVGGRLASGEFVIFCDADIKMNPDMLSKMYQELTSHPEASYVYSAFKFGHKKFSLWPFDPEKLKQMPYIHTTSLMRKKDWPEFDKTLKRFQDWDLWLTMLDRGHVGHFIPEVLFTIQAGGTMSSWQPKIFYKIPFLPQVKKYNQAKDIIRLKHSL